MTIARNSALRPATKTRSRASSSGHSSGTIGSQAGCLRTVTLNIGAAAAPRATAILRWLRRRAYDLIVLTETSDGPGTALLRGGLEQSGYTVCTQTGGGDRGVLVATRLPVKSVLVDKLRVTLPWRVASVELDTAPAVCVVGVYVPSRDRSMPKVARKEAFMESLLTSIGTMPASMRERLLLVGDYNAVARRHEPRLPGFFPYEYKFHQSLEEMGLSAVHELRPRRAHPHSWIGRTGIGYLYDYLHVGSGLHDRVERFEYLHGPRTRRMSDHAAVTMRLRIS